MNKETNNMIFYTMDGCTKCVNLKERLEQAGFKLDVRNGPNHIKEIRALQTSVRSYPVIVVDGDDGLNVVTDHETLFN